MTSVFMPPPMLRTTRPMHMENLFQDRSRAPSLTSSHRSADSVSSSVASPTESRYESRYQDMRTLSPAFEEIPDDQISLQSYAMSVAPKKSKWSLLGRFQRRNRMPVERSASVQEVRSSSRKASISTLALHIRSNSSMLQLSPKPSTPTRKDIDNQELSSRKCYYSIARNCPGWVIGGTHGDACESCLREGFFGSP